LTILVSAFQRSKTPKSAEGGVLEDKPKAEIQGYPGLLSEAKGLIGDGIVGFWAVAPLSGIGASGLACAESLLALPQERGAHAYIEIGLLSVHNILTLSTWMESPLTCPVTAT
jgi:hypothetical protein